MKREFEFGIGNLDCANCANKIEVHLNKQDYILEAKLNFMLKKLSIKTKELMEEEILRAKVEQLADDIEKGVKIYNTVNETEEICHDGSCHCGGHDHEHSHNHTHKGCHTHHHEQAHGGQKNKFLNKEKWSGISLAAGLGLFGAAIVSDIPLLYIVAYLLVGCDIVWQAVRNLTKGRMLDENFLMTLATAAAFAIDKYPEAVAVMAFYKIGEYMQGRAVGYSRREIAKAMDIRPEFARVIAEGKEEIKAPAKVKVGELLEVRAGERIPLDGVIVEGTTLLDTSMLTGESIPAAVKVGDQVLSGSINKEGVIRIKVTASFKNSTVSKILELLENATSKKSQSENFITKFARWYTPIVVGLAIFIAIVPSMVMGNWQEWLYTSITFLVISCPCAVVVSVPLGFFAGLGASAHKGVLVKGSNYLEELNSIDTIVLDKTGTITKGQFGVSKIIEGSAGREEILRVAAALEKGSNHPIAKSIMEAYDGEVPYTLCNVKEISGEGMSGLKQGKVILAGNEKLMQRYHIEVPEIKTVGSYVYVAEDGRFLGCIVAADQIKADSKAAIAKLKAEGIKKVIMLTGDKKEIAEQVGREVGVDKVYAELLPQHKVEKLEETLKEGKVAFVGDGINDAPVLARADIGIAMGGAGSDAAIEAADIVLMTDELSSIGEVLHVAKRTRRIVMQNIIFAIGIKILVMLLSILGMANMWLAIFADVGVALLAVMNSIRVLGGDISFIKKMLK